MKVIWNACGDYWKLPKTEFEGSTVPYKPLFGDGWSPGYLVMEEDESDHGRAAGTGAWQEAGRSGAARPPGSDTGSDYGSEGSGWVVRSSRAGGGEAWRDLLMKSGAAIALVTFRRLSPITTTTSDSI